MAKVKAVPEGMHTITPVIAVDGCADAMEFWKKAFGAQELSRALDQSGKKVMHGALRIGDSTFFCNDVFPEMGSVAHPANLWLYVEDVDAAFKRAADAGCKPVMQPADMFWGDRFGQLTDRWGNRWSIAQHIKDMTPEEMQKAEKAAMEQMAKKK